MGHTVISWEWVGKFGPDIRLLGTVIAFLACSWPWGKSPPASVLLKDRSGPLVCSVPFCHPAQMLLLCTGRVLLLWSVDAVGRVGEASTEKCLLWIKTHLIQNNSNLLVLAQAPCHRKERERSSDRMLQIIYNCGKKQSAASFYSQIVGAASNVDIS